MSGIVLGKYGIEMSGPQDQISSGQDYQILQLTNSEATAPDAHVMPSNLQFHLVPVHFSSYQLDGPNPIVLRILWARAVADCCFKAQEIS